MKIEIPKIQALFLYNRKETHNSRKTKRLMIQNHFVNIETSNGAEFDHQTPDMKTKTNNFQILIAKVFFSAKCIFPTDYPSNYKDKKMPILDITLAMVTRNTGKKTL